jgi:N-acetyl sugar amidotransferase
MSTRPRIRFDADGRCNACVWSEKKRTLDWTPRLAELEELLDANRRDDGGFDCVVPVSGGKDGSYVAHTLKHRFGMNPLSVTILPPLPTEIGDKNLRNFIGSGYPHVSISPDTEAMRSLNKYGFTEMGFPYYGWLTAITVAPLEIAGRFDCELVFYGEDGEVEYGGAPETEGTPYRSLEYLEQVYLEGGYEKVLQASALDPSKLRFFTFPDQADSRMRSLKRLNWSYFESWDPYRNYLVAKERCGLEDAPESNSGTFTNFAQNDQFLYSLHAYLMYLKFGFGRANQDACIDIRRGALTREQGIQLVNLYDGNFPEEHLDLFLEYFEMSEGAFFGTLDRWTNKRLFERKGRNLLPTFSVN